MAEALRDDSDPVETGSKEKGCIRPKEIGVTYRDCGETKFNIKEYRDDAFQVTIIILCTHI